MGVPISITNEDGHQIDNRLESVVIRSQIADFAEFTITGLGFDGFHLNAELIPDSDPAFLATLALIREQLPETAFFSTTAHALRPLRPVTSIPYPHAPHHWTPEFLSEVATHVDQIALMAYDSGLPFPRDYRSWISYQTEMSASALSDNDVDLLIGLPTSEEWTITHQTQAETLAHALYGFSNGFAAGIDGIALYPYWEIDDSEWALIQDK